MTLDFTCNMAHARRWYRVRTIRPGDWVRVAGEIDWYIVAQDGTARRFVFATRADIGASHDGRERCIAKRDISHVARAVCEDV